MTPEQAKTLWCPFARASGYRAEQTECNRDDRGEPNPCCLCITSKCMAWHQGTGWGKCRLMEPS